MSKVLVFLEDSGRVGVVSLPFEAMSVDDLDQAIIPDCIAYNLIDSEDLPTDHPRYQWATDAESLANGLVFVSEQLALEAKILEVNRMADELILKYLPLKTQMRMLSEAMMVIADNSLTQAEKDFRLSDPKAYFAWSKSVRDYSDSLIASLVAGEDADINSGWPGWPPAGLLGEAL